jgi:hypothetical protein
MSDPKDAAGEAFVRMRRVAAARLVRKEELEAELLKLRRDRLSLEGVTIDEDAGLRKELDDRIAAVGAELAGVESEYQDALREMGELGKLARDAEVAGARATVAAAAEPDPLLRSAEELALDNVRAHVAELEAQVKVGKELRELEEDPPPPAPGPGKRTL